MHQWFFLICEYKLLIQVDKLFIFLTHFCLHCFQGFGNKNPLLREINHLPLCINGFWWFVAVLGNKNRWFTEINGLFIWLNCFWWFLWWIGRFSFFIPKTAENHENTLIQRDNPFSSLHQGFFPEPKTKTMKNHWFEK